MKTKICAWLVMAGLTLAWGEAIVVPPEEWTIQPGLQHNMSLYAVVEDFDGNRVETAGSRLAVLDADGLCRGVAEIGDGPAGKLFQVLIGSNAAQENGLVLQVLDAFDGEIHDIRETIAFANDTTVPAENYMASPLVLHYKPLTAELALPLVQNWNWLSFNVAQGDRVLDEFLVDYAVHATDGDIIKSQSGQATYSNGRWWPSPASFRLEPGRMYKLLKQSAGACTLTVEGVPCTGEEAISVTAGWNWVGYTGAAPATVGALCKEGGFSDNDLMKPQSGSQATFSGGRWYGGLVLRPGQGYMLKLTAGGTIDFRDAPQNAAQ